MGNHFLLKKTRFPQTCIKSNPVYVKLPTVPLASFGCVFIRTGKEKLKELEELMSGQGIFSEDFSCGLGDFMEVDGDNKETPFPPPIGNNGDEEPEKGKKKDPLPPLDGPLGAAEIVGRYKKAILSRQGVFRDLHQKWTAASPSTGTKLIFISV